MIQVRPVAVVAVAVAVAAADSAAVESVASQVEIARNSQDEHVGPDHWRGLYH